MSTGVSRPSAAASRQLELALRDGLVRLADLAAEDRAERAGCRCSGKIRAASSRPIGPASRRGRTCARRPSSRRPRCRPRRRRRSRPGAPSIRSRPASARAAVGSTRDARTPGAAARPPGRRPVRCERVLPQSPSRQLPGRCWHIRHPVAGPARPYRQSAARTLRLGGSRRRDRERVDRAVVHRSWTAAPDQPVLVDPAQPLELGRGDDRAQVISAALVDAPPRRPRAGRPRSSPRARRQVSHRPLPRPRPRASPRRSSA